MITTMPRVRKPFGEHPFSPRLHRPHFVRLQYMLEPHFQPDRAPSIFISFHGLVRQDHRGKLDVKYLGKRGSHKDEFCMPNADARTKVGQQRMNEQENKSKAMSRNITSREKTSTTPDKVFRVPIDFRTVYMECKWYGALAVGKPTLKPSSRMRLKLFQFDQVNTLRKVRSKGSDPSRKASCPFHPSTWRMCSQNSCKALGLRCPNIEMLN